MAGIPTANVLNKYRSVTYNFSLSCIKPDDLKNPKSYQQAMQDFMILQSSGKVGGMNPSAVAPIKINIGATQVDDDGNPLVIESTAEQKTLVESYNKNSAGRFNMFMDNVEVETIMTPTTETGTALATKLKFEVVEPYSLNGFIDALAVSAKAAGHPNHVGAIFLLKIEFKGYPDSDTGPSGKPEVVEYATRYFPLKITGIEVSVNENGTKYTCTAVPYNEMGLSAPNKIIASLQMSGKTVGEILENMFVSLNKKIVERLEQEKSTEKKKDRDRYEIYFPVMPPPSEGYTSDNIKAAKKNEIYSKPMNKILSDNNVFTFPKPNPGDYGSTAGAGRGSAQAAASDPRLTEEQKAAILKEQQSKVREYNPDKVSIMFSEGANIHDIIAAVIRDSDYLKKILEDVAAAKDANGMIDYFKIHVNTVPEAFDAENGVRIHTYQYVITPYKIHYTKLPGQKFTNWSTVDLDPLVKRTYNYIYTGENVDVLNFNLKFNQLYFQSGNPKAGNANSDGTSNTASATNDNKVKLPTGAAVSGAESTTPAPEQRQVAEANSQELRAGARRTDPYYMLAYNAHKTILESVDLIKGDLDILGDPYYLVTGGIGNFIPPVQDNAITLDGQANVQAAEPFVKLNFRNPIDIDNETGLMQFDKFDFVEEYSGIYRVIKCRSSFKEGVFKQTLNILRLNGQTTPAQRKRPSKPFEFIESPKAGSTTIKDTASPDIAKSGIKPNEFDLSKMISKGLPTTGVPGFLSNLQSQGGPLGSLAAGASAVAGLVQQGIGSLGKGLGAGSGISLPGGISSTIDKIATSTRLGANGLQTLSGLANKVTSSIPNGVTAPSVNADTLVNSVQGAAVGGADPLVSNALNKISAIQSGGANIDLANKLGVDTSQISGIGGNFASNLTAKLGDVAKAIPASVNLNDAKDSGLILSNLNANALKNLPASIPKVTAPEAPIELSDSLGSSKYMELLSKAIKSKSADQTSTEPASIAGQVAANSTPTWITDPVTGEQVRNYSEEDVQRMRASNKSLSDKLTNALGFGTTKAQDNANNAVEQLTNPTEEQLAAQKLKGLSLSDLKSKLTGVGSSLGLDTDNLLDVNSTPNLTAMAGAMKSSLNPLSQLAGVNITAPSALSDPSALGKLQGAIGSVQNVVSNATDISNKFAPSTGSSPLDALLKSKGVINAGV